MPRFRQMHLMNLEEIRDYALSLPNTEESLPFGPDNLVFKVNNKMFLLLSLDEIPVRFNVKCEPNRAIDLREEFPDSVLPGYHMNKKHWNTIVVNGQIAFATLKSMISDSYALVLKK